MEVKYESINTHLDKEKTKIQKTLESYDEKDELTKTLRNTHDLKYSKMENTGGQTHRPGDIEEANHKEGATGDHHELVVVTPSIW